jgi:hypothetical protein
MISPNKHLKQKPIRYAKLWDQILAHFFNYFAYYNSPKKDAFDHKFECCRLNEKGLTWFHILFLFI